VLRALEKEYDFMSGKQQDSSEKSKGASVFSSLNSSSVSSKIDQL